MDRLPEFPEGLVSDPTPQGDDYILDLPQVNDSIPVKSIAAVRSVRRAVFVVELNTWIYEVYLSIGMRWIVKNAGAWEVLEDEAVPAKYRTAGQGSNPNLGSIRPPVRDLDPR